MPRGKKPFPKEMRRDRLLMFRMTDQEHAALERLAGPRPLAQFIRSSIFGQRPRRAVPAK